jgi:energy-coupling factor transporter ATP-binding protein EcfA2
MSSLAVLKEQLARVVVGDPPAAGSGLPTGIDALDRMLGDGGGLPRGRLTEIRGARGSGKTTLVRHIVGTTLAAGGGVACIDAGRTLAPRDWAALSGRGAPLWMVRPRDPARGTWCADVLLRSGGFALVVLDGAPLSILTRPVTARLTSLARDAGAVFLVVGDGTEDGGRATMLGGALRLVVRRAGAREARGARGIREMSGGRRSRRCLIAIEKGGGGVSGTSRHRFVEVSCAIGVARRLCTYPEVPDRRGVEWTRAGAPGSDRGGKGRGERAAGAPPSGATARGRDLPRKRRCAEPDALPSPTSAPPLPLAIAVLG